MKLVAIGLYPNYCCLQGVSWERERLLRPPHELLRDDSEAAKAQEMMITRVK
jgi:hypothetical protein